MFPHFKNENEEKRRKFVVSRRRFKNSKYFPINMAKHEFGVYWYIREIWHVRFRKLLRLDVTLSFTVTWTHHHMYSTVLPWYVYNYCFNGKIRRFRVATNLFSLCLFSDDPYQTYFLLFLFQEKAKSHNENLIREIKVNFENRMLKDIGSSYLNDDSFINLFMKSKSTALEEVSLSSYIFSC